MRIIYVVLAALLLSGCTPAQNAAWSQIEKVVLADIENGTALSAIESTVEQIYPPAAGDAQLADVIIQAAIDLLEATGAIPTPSTANLANLKSAMALKCSGRCVKAAAAK
jgi:hypothetical protein